MDSCKCQTAPASLAEPGITRYISVDERVSCRRFRCARPLRLLSHATKDCRQKRQFPRQARRSRLRRLLCGRYFS